MVIRLEFNSARELGMVTFARTVIRVLDLTKAIIEKKKLYRGLDFDLVISDTQDAKVYDDKSMTPERNTSIMVKCIPSEQPGRELLVRMEAETATVVTYESRQQR